jgi:hypothetical protein
MSLTSYRAAPPRVTKRRSKNIMNGFFEYALAAKPGDDLLFHRLSDSTIGAVRFHGRVRDGIGWVTDAMATKLWGQRIFGFFDAKAKGHRIRTDDAVDDGGTLKREQSN